MPYSIYTTKNARLDIKEATEWEDKRHPGLSDRFLSDLEEKIIRISNNPKHYQIRYLSVHCAPLDIFQYLIHYTIVEREQQVIILRILHTSRKPIF